MKRASLNTLYIYSLVYAMLGCYPRIAVAQQSPERSTAVASFTRLKRAAVPLLRLTLNDRFVGTFAFDTGTNTTYLTESLSQRLSLKPTSLLDENHHPHFSDGNLDRVVKVERLQFGNNYLSNVPFRLIDDKRFSRLLGEDIDGILGATVLKPYAMLFDFSHDVISLWHPGGLAREDRKKINMEDAVALPMDYSDDGFTIHVKFSQGEQSKSVSTGDQVLLIDTGQAITHISLDMARHLKLKAVKKGLIDSTFDGNQKAEEGILDTLMVGDVALHNIRVRYPNPTPPNFSPTLGLDILSQGKFMFDWPNKTFYFKLVSTVENKPVTELRQTEPTKIPQEAGLLPSLSVVPFTTPPIAPLPLVSVAFDGGKPHLFIVDPGTPNCLIDPDFVKAEQIATEKITRERNTLDVAVPDRMVIEAPMPLTLKRIPFVVQDMSSTRALIGGGAEVAGILGANFLRAFLERIDFSRKQITFFSKDHPVLAGKQVSHVPLQEEDAGYYLKAIVDGKSARFALGFMHKDTSVQQPDLLAALKPLATLRELRTAEGVEEQTLRLHALTVEGVTWNRPVVTHLQDPSDRENVFGLDFYSRFYVTLDLEAKQLYLEADPNYKEDAAKWLGTGFKVIQGPDATLIVGGVTVPSPASEAGVKAGDEILEINGFPIATTPPSTIYSATKRVVGAIVKLKIQRKGEGRSREFSLKMRTLL